MTVCQGRRWMLAALCVALLPLHAAQAQDNASTSSQVGAETSLSDLLSGQAAPLTLRLRDLNANWRQFSVSEDNDAAMSLLATIIADFNVVSDYNSYFTQGKTLRNNGETYIVAYRLQLTPQEFQAIAKTSDNGSDSPAKPTKMPSDRILTLSLLNQRTVGSLKNVRPFDTSIIATPQQIAATQTQEDEAQSVNNLKQIGVAMMQYTQDYDDKFPPMQSITSIRQIESESSAGITKHVQVVLQPYIKSTTVFAHPRTKEIYRPNPILSRKLRAHIDNPAAFVAFYEASAAPDGKRAVLYADGHVQRVDETQWPALKRASKIGVAVPAATSAQANAPPGTQTSNVASADAVPLSGAAALYYLYKTRQTYSSGGPQGVHFLSKNGRLYFRYADTGKFQYVSPPREPIFINIREAAPYRAYQGFNGSNTGKSFGGYGPNGQGKNFKDAVPIQPLEGY